MDIKNPVVTGVDIHTIIPPLPGKEELRKVTKVRKGMGVAKYSTLITTVPAEACKMLDIKAGDSLMWSITPGVRVMGVLKIDSLLTEHTALMWDLVDKLEADSNLSEESKEPLRAMRKVLSAMGPEKKLTLEESKKELKKIVKEHKEKKEN